MSVLLGIGSAFATDSYATRFFVPKYPKTMKTIWIPKGNEYEIYDVENIYYCESKNQYTIFHIEDGSEKLKTVMSSKGIGEWEKDLEKYHFCRIHSQTLVNLKHVKKFINKENGVIVLTNNQNLSVSKSKKHKFMTDSGIRQ